jgi:hypothetical protein
LMLSPTFRVVVQNCVWGYVQLGFHFNNPTGLFAAGD